MSLKERPQQAGGPDCPVQHWRAAGPAGGRHRAAADPAGGHHRGAGPAGGHHRGAGPAGGHHRGAGPTGGQQRQAGEEEGVGHAGPPPTSRIAEEVAAVAELLALSAHHVVLALNVEDLVLGGAAPSRHLPFCWKEGC